MHIWVFDNQTYPIFMGFHDGFSRWMPSLESSRRDKARLPVWMAQHHPFFLAKDNRFFQLCMNLGKRFTIEFLGVPSFRQTQIG